MWISGRYYNELLKSLDKLSRGDFTIDEKKLMGYKSVTHQRLSSRLVEIKKVIESNERMRNESIDNLIKGNFVKIEDEDDSKGRYGKYNFKYNALIDYLEEMNYRMDEFQNLIIHKGKIDCKLTSDGID